MPVTIDTDEKLQRVIVTISEGTRWASFEAATLSTIAIEPDLTEWTWIIDDRGPIEDIDVAGVARLGAEFQRRVRDPLRRTYTVVVTTDRFFDTWLTVVDMNHGARKHLTAPTLPAAYALVDKLTAE
ncbi:MAG: hypothetical protein EON58_15165 [Alphaproteobacteria bacterium]|nr:MAG: hypothetical protein EON58_15165 [Alphaproteobacteria bacterium]